MGRRSTKTTKTGKFMNPTDQWRKESRKKELKKNKKQRSAVREAVIKTKSPAAIIKEIEEIEQQGVEILWVYYKLMLLFKITWVYIAPM